MNTFYFVGRSCPPNVPKRDSMSPDQFSEKFNSYAHMIDLSDEELLKDNRAAFPEVKIERIRRKFYPHLPSRLESMFFWETLTEARKYILSGWMQQEKGIVYMFEVKEFYKPVFSADLLLFTMIGRLKQFRNTWDTFKKTNAAGFIKPTFEETVDELCHAYWQGKFVKDLGLSGEYSMKELLVCGKAEVAPHVQI